MKKHSLLMPHSCKTAGWIILGIGFILFILCEIIGSDFDFTFNDIRGLFGVEPISTENSSSLSGFNPNTQLMYTIMSIFLLVGCFITGFSRCKEEDEFTTHLRYKALTITMYILMALELITLIVFWGLSFLAVQLYLIMLAPVFYVFYFHIMLQIERKRNEE